MAGMEQQRHLTVFGATSFVGQILTRYLYGRFGTDGDLRWAIAGRSEKKLRELHGSLYPKAAKLPQIVANAGDEKALREMCAESRVVISTVGPYALYGEPLVKICANTGTDYCDLTGEVQWIRRMIRKYEGAARASGARIVHCCGFDSIPSDLGVHFLQKHAMQKYGKTCPRVKLRVKAMRGGASGGTIASMLNVVKEASDDPGATPGAREPVFAVPGRLHAAASAAQRLARGVRRRLQVVDRTVRDGGDQHPHRPSHERPVEAGVWR